MNEARQSTPNEAARLGDASLATRAARSSLWSVLGHLGQTALGLLAFALLSPVLTPTDYGLVGMATAISGLLSVLGDAGMIAALVRSAEIDEVSEATAFWLALACAASLTAISLAIAPVLGWFYGDHLVTRLALALALSFLFAVPYRVSFAKLMKALQFKTLTLTSLAATGAGVAVALGVAHLGGGAWALVAQTLTTLGVQSLLMVLAAPYCATLGAFSLERGRKLVAFGGRMGSYSLSMTLSRMGDSVLGGRYVGATAVGLVGMGVKLIGMPAQRVSNALASVFLPTVLELDRERQGWAFTRALRLTGLLIIPLCAGVFAVAPEFVKLLPSRWGGLTNTLRLYALGSLLEPISNYSLAILMAQGRAGALLRLALLLVPIGWGGTLLGVWRCSAEWLVVGWIMWNGVSVLAMLAMLRLGRAVSSALSGPLLAGAAMVVAVRIALLATGTADRLPGFPIGVLTGVACYGLTLATFLRADAKRLIQLLKLALRRSRPALAVEPSPPP
jgi:PST family polysaccharide transporter